MESKRYYPVLLSHIRSEFIKIRHTPIMWIHIIFPLLGGVLYTLFMKLYSHREWETNMNFLLEATAVVFPLIISVVCGMLSALEEKAASFQRFMMDEKGRFIPYFSKWMTAIVLGFASTVSLSLLTIIGVKVFSLGEFPAKVFLFGALYLFLGSVILYTLHMFLSIKYGLGVSVFIGVIGSLFSIMFSNVDVATWILFPFTWGVKLLQWNMETSAILVNWRIIIGVNIMVILISGLWFWRWEGRKTYE